MMWDDDWREELQKDNPECFARLCECRNTRKDIKIISKLLYQHNLNHSKEECLDRTLTWITDWNNQLNLYPDNDEYQKLLEQM